jgi:hypothetical protein
MTARIRVAPDLRAGLCAARVRRFLWDRPAVRSAICAGGAESGSKLPHSKRPIPQRARDVFFLGR